MTFTKFLENNQRFKYEYEQPSAYSTNFDAPQNMPRSLLHRLLCISDLLYNTQKATKEVRNRPCTSKDDF